MLERVGRAIKKKEGTQQPDWSTLVVLFSIENYEGTTEICRCSVQHGGRFTSTPPPALAPGTRR